MPIYQQIIDLNKTFASLPYDPIILNDLENESEEDRRDIEAMISTRYSSDSVNLIPTCKCGQTKGEFSTHTVCQECGTEVRSSVEDDLLPLLWLRKPNTVKKLINPIVFIMLKRRFSKGEFSVINYICDTAYKGTTRNLTLKNKLDALPIPRGLNNFIDNFDLVMDYLFSLTEFRVKRNSIDKLALLLQKERDKIFVDYVPIPNKSLLIIENTRFGVISDKLVIEALDAIQMMVGIDNENSTSSNKVKENRAIRALDKLCTYYTLFFKEKLRPKVGLFRRHVYGTRSNHAARAVITNLTDPHMFDEIHLPWCIGLTMFRQHIINKLMKSGLTHNASVHKILSHVDVYDKQLDDIMLEFWAGDTPTYICMVRNPSLLQSSMLRMRVGRIKNDPSDKTISIPIEITRCLNADA